MFHSRIFDAKYLAAALLALGLAAVGPSCSSNNSDGGGDGGDGGTGPTAEVCGNELDDDQNGLTDCVDPVCERTEVCCPECFTDCGEAGQVACQAVDGTVNLVCSSTGTCEHSGQVDENGEVRTGWSLVMSNMAEIKGMMNYKGQQVLVLSSERPNTAEKATCAAIMARDLDPTDPLQVNVVYETALQVSGDGDYVPAPAWPVPLPKEGEKLVVVVRFFGTAPDGVTGKPRGDIVGEGCAEFDSIREGAFEEGHEGDPAYQWEVEIHLFCGGDLNRECPEPKTCVVGLCRDTRCAEAGETCGPGHTCREWDGVPDCRKTCNPDEPDCPNLHYCDTTPGEPFVCVPAD